MPLKSQFITSEICGDRASRKDQGKKLYSSSSGLQLSSHETKKEASLLQVVATAASSVPVCNMDIEGVTVKLLLFARAKELAGTRESTLRLPRKISYHQLLNTIVDNYNLGQIKNNILLAKNEEVCEESVDIEISDRDSIAVIPPLSGG